MDKLFIFESHQTFYFHLQILHMVLKDILKLIPLDDDDVHHVYHQILIILNKQKL